MEEIILQPGESKNYTNQDYIGSEIIPLSKIMLSGNYVITGNITTRNAVHYQLDFNGEITQVVSQTFGMSYSVEVQSEPLDIYLKTLEEIDMLSYTFSLIRIQ